MSTVQDAISDITITNYERGAMESAFDNHPFLGMVKRKGNWVKASGGDQFQRQLKAGLYTAFNFADGEDVSANYTPHDLFDNFVLPWGQKGVFDTLTKFQMKKNAGKEALVSLLDERMPRMYESITTEGSGSLGYDAIRGTSTGTGLPFQGLDQVLQFGSGTTASRDVTATGTYGGLSMVAGAVDADGAPTDAFTPKGIHLDYPWNGTDADGDWLVAHTPYILEYAQRKLTFSTSNVRMRPDAFLMCENHYGKARNYLDSLAQLNISKDSGDNKWGFGSSVEEIRFGGMSLFWDTNVADGKTYVVNFDHIYFNYLDPGPVVSGDKYPGSKGGGEGADFQSIFDTSVSWNDSNLGVNIAIVVVGQYLFHPRYQGLIAVHT